MKDFDLVSAVPVMERPDGLLEKDDFDMASARPITEATPVLRPKQEVITKKPNFILSTLDEGFKEIQDLITAPGRMAGLPTPPVQSQLATETIPKIKGWLNEKVYTGRTTRVKEQDVPEEDKAKAQPAMNMPGFLEVPEKTPRWETLVEDGANLAMLGFAAVQGAAVIKNRLDVRYLAREVNKQAAKLTNEEFGKITEPNFAKEMVPGGFANDMQKKWNAAFNVARSDIINKMSAFEVLESGEVQTVAQGIKKPGLARLLMQEVAAMGESGQIQVAKPKTGDVVNFSKGGELLTGTVQSISGKLVYLDMEGSTVVANLSQLQPFEQAMAKPQEQPVLPTLEAQGEAISQEAVAKGMSAKGVAKGGEIDGAGQVKGQVAGQVPPKEPPPTAVSGAPEEPIKPDVSLKGLNIPEETKIKIAESAENITPELEKIKGEKLTHAEVLEAAKSSDILTKIIDRSQSKEAEAALLRTKQNLAAMANEKGVSDDFIKNLKIVRAFGTDAARKLGSLRISADPEAYDMKTQIINQLDDLGVKTEDIIKQAEGVDFNNQEQVTKFYRTFVKPSFMEVIDELRYINMLSSPKTHIVNVFSNMIQAGGLGPATKLASGSLDYIASKLKPGFERTHYVKEVPAYVKGSLNALPEATSKAIEVMQGKTLIERPDLKRIPTDVKWLKPFKFVTNALEASDVFFRTLAYEGEYNAQMAIGTDPVKADKIAKEKSAYLVFRSALDPSNKSGQGYVLSIIDNLTQKITDPLRNDFTINGKKVYNPLKWFVPFVQTPLNIAKQMIEFTPAGAATLPGNKDKTEQLGKALIGTLVMVTAAAIIEEGDSTWEMPKGKKEKELFISSGRQPYSIKIGDNWYNYSRLGTLALPIAIPAAIKYYTEQNPESVKPGDMEKFSKVLGGLVSFFGDQSYVKSVGDLQKTIQNAPGAAAQFVSNIPAQLIPMASLQRWINNYIIDPVFRKSEKDLSVEAIIDNAKKSIIGGTLDMEAYKDIKGRTSKREFPAINAVSPIQVSPAKDERTYREYIKERKQKVLEESKTEAIKQRKRRR